MARSRSRTASKSQSRSASASGTRSAKATSRKKTDAAAPAAADVEVVEEASGAGIDTGIAVMTTLLLVASVLFLDYVLGTSYGTGAFF